jgi:hypothetical protein
MGIGNQDAHGFSVSSLADGSQEKGETAVSFWQSAQLRTKRRGGKQ